MAESEASVNLSKFSIKEQLGVCPNSKKIFLLGKLSDREGDAIVILEKPPFSDDDFPGVFSEALEPKIYFKNDVYLSFCHYPGAKYSGKAFYSIKQIF